MNKYLGLFIDDDQKNFESIKRLFSLKKYTIAAIMKITTKIINEILSKS